MKKVLIVDDDKPKIEKIKEVLESNFKKFEFTERYSYQSGLKQILVEDYDVILLDMSMPTFDITTHDNGGQLKSFAGKDIMRYMSRKKIYTPVIIITQYDRLGCKSVELSEIILEMEERYGEFYFGTIYYDVTIEDWKKELVRAIIKKS